MDIMFPFLARISHITPLKKKLIVVAGIKDAKIKAFDPDSKTAGSEKSKVNKQDDEQADKQDQEGHLDTWA